MEWKQIEKILFNVLDHKQHVRILLYGPPGTGKTTVAKRLCNDVIIVSLHEDMSAQELLGFYVPKGGQFVWQDGLATIAFRTGKTLVLNEIDHASPSITTALHGLLDDITVAELHLPTGETIYPAYGYRVIATMNGNPHDLRPALLDRFDIRLEVKSPHPDAINTILVSGLREAVRNSYNNENPSSLTMRTALAINKLMQSGFSLEDAVYAVIGETEAPDFLNTLKMLD